MLSSNTEYILALFIQIHTFYQQHIEKIIQNCIRQ